jgi:hypothetical protein
MELNEQVAGYILRYFAKLMTDTEREAADHLTYTIKATRGRSDVSAQNEARGHRYYSRRLSNDPEILRLASDGFEAFVMRTASRILRESGDKISFNCSPKCGSLARTPTARQCRSCNYDWHDKG